MFHTEVIVRSLGTGGLTRFGFFDFQPMRELYLYLLTNHRPENGYISPVSLYVMRHWFQPRLHWLQKDWLHATMPQVGT